MSTIRQTSKKILKILYKHYLSQNPVDPLNVEEIVSQLQEDASTQEASIKELKASLNYLTDKELITPINHIKNHTLAYRITTRGIEFYEREEESVKQAESSSLLITFQGDLRGQLHINSYGSYGEDHSNSHQTIYSEKDSNQHYDMLLDFIDWVRSLLEEDNISSEIKEELEMKCDMMESILRSHQFPPFRE